MRRPAFANRALLALLTAFVVGSDLGNSAEQTKVRITTWNLEWFPNGSANEAPAEQQNQRIKEAAEPWKSMNGVDPPRGFAFAWFKIGNEEIGVYSVHLKKQSD
jgi:hypothetical protein